MSHRPIRTAIACALLLGSAAAHAQGAAVPAYPGCRLAWDYPPAAAARLAGFEVFIGPLKVAGTPAAAREIPCADLKLALGPQTIKVRALAKDDGAQSAFATLLVDYRTVTPLPAPTTVKLIMEWTAQ